MGNLEVESFFGRFKEEWGDLFADCETEREVIDLLKIKLLYYNGERTHSSLGYLTPNEFVAQELKIAAHALETFELVRIFGRAAQFD